MSLFCSTVRCVRRAIMRTSSCCVTAVTKAATLTVTNPRSPVSQRETGTARPAYPRYRRRFIIHWCQNPAILMIRIFFEISFLGHYLYLDCTEMEAMREEKKKYIIYVLISSSLSYQLQGFYIPSEFYCVFSHVVCSLDLTFISLNDNKTFHSYSYAAKQQI